MVVDTLDRQTTDRLFHALSDATRRDIVLRAARADHSVSDLAGEYPMSFAAVQKHVALLEEVGLVTKERQGRKQLVRSNIDAIRHVYRVLDQLEAVWRDRIERFGEVLAQTQGGGI